MTASIRLCGVVLSLLAGWREVVDMTGFRRANAVTLAAITAMSVWLWAVPARGSTITVDWDVVPHANGVLGDSPYYSCGDQFYYTTRTCQSLWEQGMELRALWFSFYDDKWVDGYGIGDLAVQEILPRCEPALAPCFEAFTPVAMELSGYYDTGDPPNLFVQSSRGGLLEFPSVRGRLSIDFAGSLWERLDWLEVGFYMPAACGDAVPPEDLDCSTQREKALTVDSLTFRPVPEPAGLALLASGMLGWVVRRRAAARRH